MGSVCNVLTCPHCATEDSFFEDYYYRYGGYTAFCSECGKDMWKTFKRTDDGKMVYEEKRYKLSDCRLTVVDLNTEKEIWSMVLSNIKFVNQDNIIDWINEKWSPEATIPAGCRNIFCGEEQLFYVGNQLDIDGGYLVQQKAVWDSGETGGTGLIKIQGAKGFQVIPFPTNASLEEARAIFAKTKKEAGQVDSITGQWFDSTNKKFVEL